MKLDIIDNYSGMFMIHRKNMNRKSTVWEKLTNTWSL
jgi:hypothetical protein